MSYTQGPAGGTGGVPFNDDRPGSHVTQVIVTWGAYVNTLETRWSDGAVTKHGNKDGPNIDAFVLNPGDSLIAIAGHIGNLQGDGGPYVATIRFMSRNGNNSNVFGGLAPGGGGGVLGPIFSPPSTFDNLQPYTFSAPNAQDIIGFFGRSGNYIDAIGIYTP